MQESVPGFSRGLNSLRGIAALIVVVYHALLIFQVGEVDDPHHQALDGKDPWLLLVHALLALFNGSAAVTLFFVLSGTVLSISLDRAGQSLKGTGILGFYLKRGFRLYPILVVTAVGSAILHWLYFDEGQYEAGTSWMNRYFQHEPGFREIVANAAGLSNSLNSPAWTIYVEIAASFLFPLVYALSRKPGAALPAVLGLTALAVVPVPGLRFLDEFLICFFVGALIPVHGHRLAQAFFAVPVWMRASVILLVTASLMWFGRFVTPDVFNHPFTILVQTGCAAFLVTVVYFGGTMWPLSNRLFDWLGDISYSIYLVHFIVLFTLAHFVAPRLLDVQPVEALFLNVLLAAATIAVTIPVAATLYLAVERPFQNWGRTLAREVGRRSYGGSVL